jgi:hypothetical protein
MLDAVPQFQKVLTGPRCDYCGGITRLVSIKPHRRRKWSHVRDLECTLCGTAHTVETQIPQHPH